MGRCSTSLRRSAPTLCCTSPLPAPCCTWIWWPKTPSWPTSPSVWCWPSSVCWPTSGAAWPVPAPDASCGPWRTSSLCWSSSALPAASPAPAVLLSRLQQLRSLFCLEQGPGLGWQPDVLSPVVDPLYVPLMPVFHALSFFWMGGKDGGDIQGGG